MFAQGTAFNDVYKYAPRLARVTPVLIVVTWLAIAAAIIGFRRWPGARQFLSRTLVTVGILAFLTAITAFLYHRELLREAAGGGSTASEAMSETVRAWVHGHGLYSVHLLGNAPVSPGPGWLILNSPFTLLHAYWVILPFWLALVSFTLRALYPHRKFEVNFGLLIVCSSTATYRLLGEGHDIVAIGCAMVFLVAATDRWARSPYKTALLGLLIGVVATSRVIYLPVAIVFALLVASRDRRLAAILAAVGVCTAALLFGIFSIGVHPYPPVHLFGRAHSLQPTYMIAAGAVVVAVAIGLTIRYVRPNPVSWFVWFALAFSPAHVLIGLGELIGRHWVFSTWEGANYVYAGLLPALAALLAAQRWPALPGRSKPGPDAARDTVPV